MKENIGLRLAICGKLRAGKDTVARYLESQYGFKSFAFGDPLKEAFYRAYPYATRNPKPRAGLQKFGQMSREVFGQDLWVDKTLARVGLYEGERILITDCRQQNEIDRLVAEGYKIIRVNASDDVRIGRAIEAGDDFTVHDLAHETERLVDTFAVDFEIYNDGGIADTETQIDDIMARLGASLDE